MEQRKLLFFLYLPLLFLNTCSSGIISDYYSTEDYGKMQKIDTHFHVDTYDSSIFNNSIENNFRLLSLNIDAEVPIEKQEFTLYHLEKLTYATSFKIDNWNDEDWEEKTPETLKNSFDKGAVTVKYEKT